MDELFTVDDDRRPGKKMRVRLLGKGTDLIVFCHNMHKYKCGMCWYGKGGTRDQNAGPVPGLVSLATGPRKKKNGPLWDMA